MAYVEMMVADVDLDANGEISFSEAISSNFLRIFDGFCNEMV